MSLVISTEQQQLLTSIEEKRRLLEQKQRLVRTKLENLPKANELLELELPNTDALVEHLRDYALAPLEAPLDELRDALEQVLGIPDKLEGYADELADGLGQLQALPNEVKELFEEAQQALEDAVARLTSAVREHLLPRWDTVKTQFIELGDTSAKEFEAALDNYFADFEQRIVGMIREAIERKTRAIHDVRDRTVGLQEETQRLADNIREVISGLADAEKELNRNVNRANVGVERTATAINDIRDVVNRTLGDYL